MKKTAILLFGTGSYIMFLGVFLYAIGFVGNFLVPTRLDGVPELPVSQALLIDLGLLALFAIQHSVMARPWFKRAWTRIVPEAAERSVYVLASNVAMCLMFWFWQPMGGVIWELQHPVGVAAMYGVFAFGWITVLVTTCLINHFDLFGLRQVYLYFKGREYTHSIYRTGALQAGETPHVHRVVGCVLGNTHDDQCSFVFCFGNDRLYSRRNCFRGERSCRHSRSRLCDLSRTSPQVDTAIVHAIRTSTQGCSSITRTDFDEYSWQVLSQRKAC